MISAQFDNANIIIEMKFGSHIYGTQLPTSDLDIKGIYIPTAKEILLQQVKPTLYSSTNLAPKTKNTSTDTDTEIFSLQRYLSLLMEGQTIALDMLFAPSDAYLTPPHEAWIEIRRNRKRFIHAGVTAFAAYCRQQAAKYGLKGSRIAVLRKVIQLLSTLDPLSKLVEHNELFLGLADEHKNHSNQNDLELLGIVSLPNKNTHQLETHVQVCNRKVSFHATVKYALGIFQKVLNQYGERALQADRNEGIDWKALMHAVRVLSEAKELITTGEITFPRPERELLLEIRKGERPYRQIADLIEEGLVEIEILAKTSKLRPEPDRQFAEALICKYYRKEVCHESESLET